MIFLHALQMYPFIAGRVNVTALLLRTILSDGANTPIINF